MVILYAYKEEPDMRKQILMKGNILELRPDRMTLVLRNGQQNKDIIGGQEEVFAVEHDFRTRPPTTDSAGCTLFCPHRPTGKNCCSAYVRPHNWRTSN